MMGWICVDEDGIFYGFRGESELRLRTSVPGPSDADRHQMIGLQFANAENHRYKKMNKYLSSFSMGLGSSHLL